MALQTLDRSVLSPGTRAGQTLAYYAPPFAIVELNNFTYIRLHGPEDAYQGSYDDRALLGWAKRIRAWGLKNAYVFFDNEQAGYAVLNAMRLKELISG